MSDAARRAWSRLAPTVQTVVIRHAPIAGWQAGYDAAIEDITESLGRSGVNLLQRPNGEWVVLMPLQQ